MSKSLILRPFAYNAFIISTECNLNCKDFGTIYKVLVIHIHLCLIIYAYFYHLCIYLY